MIIRELALMLSSGDSLPTLAQRSSETKLKKVGNVFRPTIPSVLAQLLGLDFKFGT